MIRSRWSQVMQQLTRAWSKNLCFWVFCVISDTIWILGPYWKSLFHNARTASPIYREAPLCLFEIWAFEQGHGGIIFLTFGGLKCLPRWWVAKKCPKVFWRFGQHSASFLSSYWKCYWYIFPKMGTFGTVWAQWGTIFSLLTREAEGAATAVWICPPRFLWEKHGSAKHCWARQISD